MALRSRLLRGVVVVGLALAAAGAAAALSDTSAPSKAQKVDDFQLSDQNYLAHHLYKMKDAKAVVLISYQAGDAAIKADAAKYTALKAAYADKGVELFLVDSRLGETRDKVRPDAQANNIDLPILFDYQQLVAEGLGLTKTAEVLVIDPRNWSVAFRGPAASASTIKALDGLISGQPVQIASQAPKGGGIVLAAKGHAADFARLTYVKDIAPIIQEKCANCHQPGGIGPMQLNNYQQIKAFAPMIREVIRTQRMPPYEPDQAVGHFKLDDRLSADQIKTLVHWAEAGAPRGEGDDPLAKVKFQAPEWALGKPDIVVTIPDFVIPATGVIDYQRPVVPNPMTEGRWMRATSFRITDKRGVHHITTGVVDGTPKPGDTASAASWRASIGGYGPGRGDNLNPPDMGVWVPASGGVAFENHYTPYGKQSVEKSQMGMYFFPKGQEPKYPLRTFGIMDFGITIPAKTEFHPEIAYIDVPKDMVLYGLTPHAHVRGGSAQVSVRYPDGHEDLVLSLPKYDFNWQYEYYLAEPLKVPAGARVITRWTYDNSSRNAANPDPTKEVIFGEQTWQEMLVVYLHYRWEGETVKALRDDYDVSMSAGSLMGSLDDNQDNRLSLAELRGLRATAIKANFAAADANHDGFIDRAELAVAQKAFAPQRRAPAQAVTPVAKPTSSIN